MKTSIVHVVVALLALAGTAVLLGVVAPASAQTASTQGILTWQAQNFFPADFQGKSLPTENARVLVSLSALRAGRFVDLSKTPVRWFLDTKSVAQGVGLTDLEFTVKKQHGDFQYVRASIEWSSAETQDVAIQIPVTDSFVSIGGVSPNTPLSPGVDVTLEAFPYFFNIASLSELNFFWTVNGKRITGVLGNAVTLTVPFADTAQNSSLTVDIVAQGKKNLLEYGKGSFTARTSL